MSLPAKDESPISGRSHFSRRPRTQISFAPLRSVIHAIRSPLGDQAGKCSLIEASRSGVGGEPSSGTSTMS